MGKACGLVAFAIGCGPSVGDPAAGTDEGGSSGTVGAATSSTQVSDTGTESGAVDSTDGTAGEPATQLECTWDLDRALRWGTVEHLVGSGSEDLWGCSLSTCMRFDGRALTELSPDDAFIDAVWAAGVDDVWVAAGTIVHRWNGRVWSALELPVASVDARQLSGTGPEDTWLFGYGADGGLVLHWDGAQWTDESGSLSADVAIDGWALAADDVVAAGPSFVLHYDGESWTSTANPGSAPITEVWGIDGVAFLGTQDGTILRRDGDAWSPVLPAIEGEIVQLTGRSADELLALHSIGPTTVVSHLVDGVWSQLDADLVVGAVWASPDAIARVGYRDDDCGTLDVLRVATNDGQETELTFRELGPSYRAGWMENDGTLYLGDEAGFARVDEDVCVDTTLGPVVAMTGDFAGTKWFATSSQIWRLEPGGTTEIPYPFDEPGGAITADGSGTLSFSSTEVYRSICGSTSFAQRGDREWSTLATVSCAPEIDALAGRLWASGPNASFKSGVVPRLLRLDGTRWAEYPIPDGKPTRTLAAVGEGAYVVTTEALWFLDGEEWTQIDARVGLLLDEVAYVEATAPDDVWVVGRHAGEDELWHFDGVAWSGVSLPAEFTTLAVAASGHVGLRGDNRLLRGECSRL